MIIFDAPLIDYVFQPIVNRMMRHPADLARTCAYGGFVLSCTCGLLSLLWYGNPDVDLIVITIMTMIVQTVMLMLSLWITGICRSLLRPGYMNLFRALCAPIRLVMLAILLLATVTATRIFVRTDITFIMLLSNLMWMSGFYFSSCELPPPRSLRLTPLVPVTG